MRLINADELITAFPCGESIRTESVRATIKNMPTIEVSEDCISKAELRKSLARPLENNNTDEMYWKGWHDCTVAVETRIADAPSVVPRRAEGEWLLDGRCSECLVSPLTTHKNYCPNCGAKMKGVDE